MKRVFVLFLAMVYFAVSSGITVNMHYCMGHFVNASFGVADGDSHECGYCGMAKKKGGNGCCHDQHKTIKSDTDHSLANQPEVPAPSFLPAHIPAIQLLFNPVVPAAAEPELVFSAHAPPDPPDCPLFLRVRNLRI